MRKRIPFCRPGRNDLIFSLAAIGGIFALAFCGSIRAQDVAANVAVGSDPAFGADASLKANF